MATSILLRSQTLSFVGMRFFRRSNFLKGRDAECFECGEIPVFRVRAPNLYADRFGLTENEAVSWIENLFHRINQQHQFPNEVGVGLVRNLGIGDTCDIFLVFSWVFIL